MQPSTGGKGTGPQHFRLRAGPEDPQRGMEVWGGASSEARVGAPSPEQGKDSKWERVLSEKVPEGEKERGWGCRDFREKEAEG